MATLTEKYTPYSAYKPSGTEWFGDVPEHWDVKRLKHLVGKVGSGKTPKGGAERYVDDGVMLLRSQNVHFGELRLADVAYIDADTDAEMAGSRVLEGDILLNITGASLGRSCVARLRGKDANVNQHVCILRPNEQQDEPEFLAYSVESRSLQDQIFNNENGVSRDALNFEQIGDLVFARPAKIEQRAIVAFLDRETARFDALVAKKERLVELLQEKRTALITRAVTRGLDPDAPMQDSGVEWLGEFPAHWEAKKLKVMVPGITVGIVVTPSKYYVDQGVPCLRSLNIAQGKVSTEDLVFISEEANLLHKKSQIFTDDVVIVRTGRAGVAVVVPPEFDGANCVDLLIVRKSKNLHSRFFYYVMNSQMTSAQVSLNSVGAIQEHYNTTTLSNLRIPCIPYTEQQAIAAFLDRETAKIDSLVAKIREAIERLSEFRTAIISAAVTGWIDVREEAGCR